MTACIINILSPLALYQHIGDGQGNSSMYTFICDELAQVLMNTKPDLSTIDNQWETIKTTITI